MLRVKGTQKKEHKVCYFCMTKKTMQITVQFHLPGEQKASVQSHYARHLCIRGQEPITLVRS